MRGYALRSLFALCAILALATAAAAEPFDANLKSRLYRTHLAQAADECGTATTVISGVGACPAANVNTSTRRFQSGRLIVRSTPIRDQVVAILRSRGNAVVPKDLAGMNLRVRLTLRISRRTGIGPAATWVDQVVTCGGGSPPVPANGTYFFSGNLAGAAPNCGLSVPLADLSFEKEVIDAAIIDNDTGLPVAVPGIRRKP